MLSAKLTVDRGGVIREWNAAAEKIFGHSAREAEGQLVEIIIPPEERAAHWKGFHAAMQRGSLQFSPEQALDAEAIHKSGARIPVDVFLSPNRAADGSIVSLSVTIKPR